MFFIIRFTILGLNSFAKFKSQHNYQTKREVAKLLAVLTTTLEQCTAIRRSNYLDNGFNNYLSMFEVKRLNHLSFLVIFLVTIQIVYKFKNFNST